ncbi:MAG: hypothetical protein GX491_17570 [Chloroflexi bacterium]|nr:hypothetical protein [Chloroflexota bacterium]
MTRRFLLTFAVLAIALLAFSACSGLIPWTGAGDDDPTMPSQDQIATQEALIREAAAATATYIAVSTEIAQIQTEVAQIPVETATSEPVEQQPTAVEPAQATATPQPTATLAQPTPTTYVLPTATPAPPTPTPIPCLAAQFVGDVTIPDGTTLAPGQAFTKTWRLRNVGSCTWTTAFDLVFISGDSMNGPAAVDFQGDVAPGGVVDISVNLTAPSTEGSYRGNWKLRDGAGVIFGVGQRSANFFVDIKVSAPRTSSPYDLASTYCTAEWSTGAGRLTCPSPENDSKGFVIRQDRPVLETGYIDDEDALYVSPQMVTDGWITAKYPAMRINTGDHFMAIIGCANNAKNCNVYFQLDYQIGNGSVVNLGKWHEVHDDQYYPLDVDLSSLAGQDVKLILTVHANGVYDQDRVLWLAPRVEKR